MLNKITSVILFLLGAVTLYMAIRLVMVGGSPFYVLMGLVFIISAVLLVLRKRSVLTLYAIFMWLTLAWIIYEVGFDKWQWIPRGDIVALIGLWLALPWMTRPLNRLHQSNRGFHPFLGGTVIIMLVMVIALCFYDPYPTEGSFGNDETAATDGGGQDYNNWVAYGGNDMGQRYSGLNQINTKNATHLKVAWEYHTGDLRNPQKDATEYTFEATPLKANNSLYLCTPHGRVVALDPDTGKRKWQYSPLPDPSIDQQHQTCRGVAYYQEPAQANGPAKANDSTAQQNQVAENTATGQAASRQTAPSSSSPASDAMASNGGQCVRRIFSTTATTPQLVALDANTGKLCEDFGNHGKVDLLAGLGQVRPHAYMETAAPLVAGDLVIVGGSVTDNGYQRGNPSGVIRAYDVHTGKLVWNFDASQPNQTAPLSNGATYPHDTPVAWATLSADIKNNLVYVPFGNASPDEVGIDRDPNSNTEKMRDAIVALDLKTGQMKWKFQTSHHDLWDRDNPSQPSLLNITYDGHSQPAMVLPTKTGNVFVLNRLTGQPIYPVHEYKTSTKGIPGEHYAASQPVSALSFIPHPLKESSMWGMTPFDQMSCRITFKSARYDGNPWTPSTEHGSIINPGNIGVFNWGSVAVDPVRQILVAAPVRLAYYYHLVPRQASDENRRLITTPKQGYWNENFGGHYAIKIAPFSSPLGIPCQAPPWGTLAGVNLKTGKVVWDRRIGTTKNLKTAFLPGRFPVGFPVGMVAHGGGIITQGGLFIQAATVDDYFRVYDLNNGKVLYQHELPAGGQATPSTYTGADGSQYIVVAAGGHGSLGTKLGDSVVAFKLSQ